MWTVCVCVCVCVVTNYSHFPSLFEDTIFMSLLNATITSAKLAVVGSSLICRLTASSRIPFTRKFVTSKVKTPLAAFGFGPNSVIDVLVMFVFVVNAPFTNPPSLNRIYPKIHRSPQEWVANSSFVSIRVPLLLLHRQHRQSLVVQWIPPHRQSPLYP